jgi:hypothetical protein
MIRNGPDGARQPIYLGLNTRQFCEPAKCCQNTVFCKFSVDLSPRTGTSGKVKYEAAIKLGLEDKLPVALFQKGLISCFISTSGWNRSMMTHDHPLYYPQLRSTTVYLRYLSPLAASIRKKKKNFFLFFSLTIFIFVHFQMMKSGL